MLKSMTLREPGERSHASPLFIGRSSELLRFEALLEQMQTHVSGTGVSRLHIEGTAGAGKSSLLAELRRLAGGRGWLTLQVDSRDAAGHGESLAAAILAVMPPEPDGPAPDPWAILPSYGSLCREKLSAAAARVPVLLAVDAYEAAGDAERWLCGTLLPQLPPSVLLVTAGRRGPGVWPAEPGVAEAGRMEVMRLEDFTAAEVRAYAEASGRREAGEADRLWAASQGHPLTLAALVMAGEGEAAGRGPGLEAGTGLQAYLLGRWLREDGADELRPLLDAAAMLPSFQHERLEELMEAEVAQAEFGRLCALSFVRPHGEGGWEIHGQLRKLLAGDLARRQPALHERLTKRSAQLLDDNPYGFTEREAEVARMVLDCHRTADIAQKLIVAEITVKKHLSHIFEKTGVRNRKELIRKLMGS
ncbi:helix-turn-helix transcriptional regulator [Paenibacillus mucilaginosus]|uniref:Transcriptional regulator, LuxR family n=1 Tax=Paenibacillus mucilaginosus (strain KNP414) TaxID=1036673 RepID=F8FLT3_PAEMK|nr:LuxR C-terminal-related transcriptional regulator [Paenibacillus mucilaginosus]AEI44849.1 transcriptional regulator, LuxR family [Paenibacillus mucilaginosus KNP414]MCG7214895.1 LuxR C-terminal-related transcriptional regulator [Paenibacillus mucilaginosus]WDM26373.1 LuxR family transcriptional regulator [Paenibacillus mucilaginosus]